MATPIHCNRDIVKTKWCNTIHKAQSTKIGCAFSLSAPYSEERRKTASEAAKKYGVHRKITHFMETGIEKFVPCMV